MFEMLLMLGNGFVTPDIAIANCLHKLLTVQIMAHAPTQMHYADAPENRFIEQKMCQVFLLTKKNSVEMQVDHEDGGLVLEIINLPEAMKLHTENVFEGM